MTDDYEELVSAALQARQQAYAKYSHYSVGAALRVESGHVFVGCNVENASLGLTMCAERVAIYNAVTSGHRRFAVLAVATENGAAPCGACRQVLAEFHNNLPLLIVGSGEDAEVRRMQLAELLPEQFEI